MDVTKSVFQLLFLAVQDEGIVTVELEKTTTTTCGLNSEMLHYTHPDVCYNFTWVFWE
jgi:hypothetical protein